MVADALCGGCRVIFELMMGKLVMQPQYAMQILHKMVPNIVQSYTLMTDCACKPLADRPCTVFEQLAKISPKTGQV